MDVIQGLEAISRMTFNTSRLFDPKLGKNGLWVKYLNLYCGFDIETTTVNDRAYMWVWQFSAMTDTDEVIVIKGRTWGEFTYFIGKLKRALNLRPSARVIVWVANYSFEFGFIQHLFEWSEMFAKEKRQPLYTRTGGVEFREALTISGGGLAYLAKTYCKTQKRVGDLDFTIARNSKTPYDETENGYICNDVIILSEFSKYIFDNYINKLKYIPLTSTAILRHEVRERAKQFAPKIEVLHEAIKSLFPPTKSDYLFTMRYLFRGGFVHGRYSAMLQILEGLKGYDIKSSYPSQMLKRYYPVSPFEDYSPKNYDDFKRCLREHCCVMTISFYGLEALTEHSIESKNKCIKCENALLDNGRIRSGDITVMLTELDFEIYSLFYKWERYELHTFQIAKRGPLPRYLLDMVYNLFEAKEAIDKEADPQAYAISKTRVNGMFGLCCTRLQFTNNVYNAHMWTPEPVEKEYSDMIAKEVLSPYWGIYTANWGRYAILKELLYPLRDYVVYTDTDSHKFKRDAYTDGVIEAYNAKEIAANKAVCEAYGYDFSIIGKLGTFEDETSDEEKGGILRFKGAGAKRYICEYKNAGFISTISGLGKKSFNDFCKSKGVDPFEEFENNMKIPAEYTKKLRPKYNDEEHSDIVEDSFGNVEKMTSASSVALLPVDFTMGMEKDYLSLITFWIERVKKHGN